MTEQKQLRAFADALINIAPPDVESLEMAALLRELLITLKESHKIVYEMTEPKLKVVKPMYYGCIDSKE